MNLTSLEEWMGKGKAPALDHSLKLFNELKSRGVQIILVSARREHLRAATIDNLVNVGFHGWASFLSSSALCIDYAPLFRFQSLVCNLFFFPASFHWAFVVHSRDILCDIFADLSIHTRTLTVVIIIHLSLQMCSANHERRRCLENVKSSH